MPILIKKPKNAVLFIKDDLGSDVFLIKKGAALASDSDVTESIKDSNYKEGDVVGLYSAIIPIPRQSTCVCTEDSEIIVFSLEEFKNLIIQNPQVGLKMLNNYGQMLSKLTLEELNIHNNDSTAKENIQHAEKALYNTGILLGNEGKKLQSLKVFIRFVEHYRLHPLSQQAQNNIRLLNFQLKDDPNLKNTLSETEHGGSTKTYKKDDVIFAEGEIGNSFYIIKEGKVKIFKVGFRGFNTIETLTNGSIFGELAIVSRAPRAATVIVESEMAVLFEINKDNMKTIFFEHPKMIIQIIKSFCVRIWQTSIRIALAQMTALQPKVIQMLLYLGAKERIEHPGNDPILLENSLQIIMDWGSLTAVELRKELDVLRETKVIKLFDSKDILIQDYSGLASILKRRISLEVIR